MSQPIHNDQLNRILLKPRFKVERRENMATILQKFKTQFSKEDCKYCNKIVDHHIVIDVPKDEGHFWSPQLHLEVEESKEKGATIKGLFGPKPQVWTLFMFVHFAVAVIFIVFLIVAYTRWSLDKDYSISLALCIAMPILWVILYFLGQLGKKKGHKQMIELDNFMKEVLDK